MAAVERVGEREARRREELMAKYALDEMQLTEAVKQESFIRGVTDSQQRLALLQMAEQRRSQADGLMWELPALSLTAQAFLLTITLGTATPAVGRVVSAIAGLVFAFGAFRGMLEHRRNEELLSRWLERCEECWDLPTFHRFDRMKLLARTAENPHPEVSTRWLRPPFLPSPQQRFKAFNLWAGVLAMAVVLDFALVVVASLDWAGAINLF